MPSAKTISTHACRSRTHLCFASARPNDTVCVHAASRRISRSVRTHCIHFRLFSPFFAQVHFITSDFTKQYDVFRLKLNAPTMHHVLWGHLLLAFCLPWKIILFGTGLQMRFLLIFPLHVLSLTSFPLFRTF